VSLSRSWRLETLGAACRRAGIDALLSPSITIEVWKKVVFLAPFAGITCFGGTTIGAVREDPVLWWRFIAMVEEATSVAPASGVGLPDGTEDERLDLARKLPTEMRSSMLHDLEAGRRLELDWLTAAVVRLGARRSVATPVSVEVYDALAPLKEGTP
jgi:2-dehydropantoate 2-reductase